MKKTSLLPCLVLAGMIGLTARAEEGGSGHYSPGQTASFIDALLGKPGFAYVNQFFYYSGKADGTIPILGDIAVNLKGTAYADSSAFLYEAPFGLFGGNYAALAAIPYVWMETTVGADLTTPRGRTISAGTKDSTSGLGDIYFAPAILGWSKGDFKWDARMGLYAPTGEYDENQLSNVGKNYWTFEPELTFNWISSKIGLEISAFAGIDFNTENNDTDYRTGDQFHLDVTVAQHLPIGKLGVFGVGANAWYYQQVTGDSGSGARLGAFEGQTVGVGPVISYIKSLGKSELAIEAKWLPEIEVQHRTKGDYVWVKLAFIF